MTTQAKWEKELNASIERHSWQKGGLSDFDVQVLKSFIRSLLEKEQVDGRTLCESCHRKTPTYGRPMK